MTISQVCFDNLGQIAEFVGAPQVFGKVCKKWGSLTQVTYKSLFSRYEQDMYLQFYTQKATTLYPNNDQAKERVCYVYEQVMKEVRRFALPSLQEVYKNDSLNPIRLSSLAESVSKLLSREAFHEQRGHSYPMNRKPPTPPLPPYPPEKIVLEDLTLSLKELVKEKQDADRIKYGNLMQALQEDFERSRESRNLILAKKMILDSLMLQNSPIIAQSDNYYQRFTNSFIIYFNRLQNWMSGN